MSEDNKINDFIDTIVDGNFSKSEELFNDLIHDRVNDAIDIEKEIVAQEIFGEPEDDLDYDDVDIETEDLSDE